MNRFPTWISVAAVGWVALMLVGRLSAQADESDGRAEQTIRVPAEALLTERGRQLAHDLKMLLRSRDTMGPKHPSLADVNKKIEAIAEQLKAWEPAANPFRDRGAAGPQDAPPQMNSHDLRQLVLQLSRRIEALEKRVQKLERENSTLKLSTE